jgi:molybdopterin/thiamine biosynthesis adenylyltransferase
MDRVEDHNRNTQVWGRRDIGQLKVRSMTNKIFNEMGIPITTYSSELSEENIKKVFEGDNFIIDGFDNTSSRKLVTDYCKSNKMDCLHVGLNAGYAEVIWNEQYTVPKKSGPDVCEYSLARNIVLLAVTVATEVIIRYIIKGIKESYTITLEDFKISLLEQ